MPLPERVTIPTIVLYLRCIIISSFFFVPRHLDLIHICYFCYFWRQSFHLHLTTNLTLLMATKRKVNLCLLCFPFFLLRSLYFKFRQFSCCICIIVCLFYKNFFLVLFGYWFKFFLSFQFPGLGWFVCFNLLHSKLNQCKGVKISDNFNHHLTSPGRVVNAINCRSGPTQKLKSRK